jgi:hypothetical protein
MFLLLLRDAYTWEGGRNLSSIWGRYGVVNGSRVHATVDHRGVMEHIGAGIYRAGLVHTKFCKIFQIPRHIESLDTCMKH